ncbi:MAG TPA: urea transporter, partial [Polyangiaceae bacterium]
ASTVLRRTADWGLPVLRSYGLLTFGGSALSGFLLLVATFERPEAALLGLFAVLVAQGVASLCGYARDTVASGYYGYNALLVGLALAHSEPLSVRIALLVGGGALLAALLSAVLGDLTRSFGLPVLALPFVLVTSLVWHTTLAPGALPFWLAPDAPGAAQAAFAKTVLAGLGAIVFRPSELGGALVLLAVVLHSRITAVALLAGSLIGAAVARELGGGNPALMLPAAYNGALTCSALGAVFYVPSRASLWVGAAGAALAGWLSAAFMLPFAPLSVPVLAWPFVLITLAAMRALGLRAPGRVPIVAHLPGAAPEANVAYQRTFAKRLKLPGPPRFVLPVRGEWRVTQGVGGALTHRGPWQHALDLEIVDVDGFPFRASGTALGDYHCFGQPVLAPGEGVVVGVHDGAPDGSPGDQDLARPWGNALVIQHAPALFSVLAHLQRGSIHVVVGRHVAAGEPVARCGSSGRSPRPHLHFQAQATPVLGAPTLDFRLVHYLLCERVPRFERLGVPAEGAAVATPDPAPLQFPPDEIGLMIEGGKRVTLRREVTLLGEQTLVDAERGERLYFVPHANGVLLTALRGSCDGLLGAMLQVAPHLPATSEPRLGFEEELAPEPLLPLGLRLLSQLLGLFGEPASAFVRGEVLRTGDRVVVESECEVRFLGRLVRRRLGRLELDRRGVASLELRSVGRGGRSLVRASRPRALPSLAEHSPRPEHGAPTCAVSR